jgi:uncharacterized protein
MFECLNRRNGEAVKRKFIFFLILYSLFLLLSCQNKTGPTVEIITQNQKSVWVTVEIADTPDTEEQGLMYRESLPENAGMLFFMPNEKIQNFWMKNTKVPLDIIFIFSDWKIGGFVEHTQPYSEANISIDKPTKYVLEVNAGFCKKHGIQPGDKIIYHPITN